MSVPRVPSRLALEVQSAECKSCLSSNEQVAAAGRDVAVTDLETYIQRVVDEAPPLSPNQRDRLALLLRGTR